MPGRNSRNPKRDNRQITAFAGFASHCQVVSAQRGSITTTRPISAVTRRTKSACRSAGRRLTAYDYECR